MWRLPKVSVTLAGRPVLETGESILLQVEGVEFEFDGTASYEGASSSGEWKDGTLLVTSRRLVWMAPGAPSRGFFLPLPAVRSCTKRAPLFKTPRLVLQVDRNPEGQPIASTPGPWESPSVAEARAVLRSHGPGAPNLDKVHGAVKGALDKRDWPDRRAAAASQSASGTSGSALSGAPGQAGSGASPLWAPVPSLAAAAPPSQAAWPSVQPIQNALPIYPGIPVSAGPGPGPGPGDVWNPLMHQQEPYRAPPPLQQSVPSPAPAAPPSALGGIAALRRQQQELNRAATDTLSAGFRDMNELMGRAEALVSLAKFIKGTLSQMGPGGDATRDAGQAAVDSLLAELGIANPVTKEVTGKAFHKELARELADLLLQQGSRPGSKPLLVERGGVMLLADIFCLFNRARGTALVSPEDLVRAADLIPDLGLGLTLRRFPSGVLAIQSADWADDKVVERLRHALSAPPGSEGLPEAAAALPWILGLGRGATAADASRLLKVPVLAAAEWLQMAEGKGALCRDEGPDGLRFYINFFSVGRARSS